MELLIITTEEHVPEGQMPFHLRSVTYLLNVTPSNPLPHPLSPPPIPLHFVLLKFEDFVTKQQLTTIVIGSCS